MNILPKSFIRKFSAHKKFIFFLTLAVVFALCLAASVLLGSTETSLKEALRALYDGDKSSAAYRIIFYVRLPRTLGAVLSGSALAVAGVIIQAVLNNSMAAPNIIGVNAGAGLALIILVAVFPLAVPFMPAAAFFGAMGACLIIYAIASRTGAGRMTITLVGIAVSSILTAGINTVKTVFPDSIYNANTFLIGGLTGLDYSRLSPAWLVIFIGIVISILISRDIDILGLGDETASGLGMNVSRMRFVLLILSSALASSAVSFAGLLGFVGLVVPHMARRFVGGSHRFLIPASALGGAALVLFCDLLCRVLFAPYEVPVGIILSFIGGPFFIVQILTQRRRTCD